MDLEYLPFPTMADVADLPHSEQIMAPSSTVSAAKMTTGKNKGVISCELILIMDQCNINTEDLLSFRLVSKSWRDAATFILLKRNACCITLRKQRLRVTSREDPSYKTYAMYSFRHNYTHRVLDELTSLMSTSPQFPVCHFGIVGHRSRNNKFNRYNDHSELNRFLSLHGGQVKTLRLTNSVSMQELDIYSKYLQNMECLELDCAFFCKNKGDQSSISIQKLDLNNAVHFKSITILRLINTGRHKRINNTELLNLLINSASQFEYFENFDLTSLQVILANGKGHLIKDFTFNFNTEIWSSTTEKVFTKIQKFASVCSSQGSDSGLSKLTLDAVDMDREDCFDIVHAINTIMRGCKDTLEELTITYVPAVGFKKPIIIPQMLNLKYLSLNLTDYCGRDPDENAHVFTIQRVPNPLKGDYQWLSLEAMFPKLQSVNLRLNDTTTYNRSDVFLHFFKMHLSENGTAVEQDVVKGGFIPSVKMLGTNFTCLNLTDAKAISALFPNVKTLTNHLDSYLMFQNYLWEMCPVATSIEISGIFWNTNHGDKFQVEMFDQFLTGFPFEICEKMRKLEKEAPSPDFIKECELLTFLKMLPSVCDMTHLRKLTLKFGELSSQFGSQVSAAYALQKMPHLKCIVSYDPVRINVGEGLDQNPVAVGDGYLASLAPYIQIVHEEQ